MVENKFSFGKNWQHFLRVMNDQRIEKAEQSLKEMLGEDDLSGKRFLDIGSGSGLFSLSARNLGAKVFSFDYDFNSVKCTQELKCRYREHDDDWSIAQGSVLDENLLKELGVFDIVYSWGVLHHTGNMWRALKNVISLIPPGGVFYTSLYNDQGWISNYWKKVKQLYNKNSFWQFSIIIFHAPYLLGLRFLVRLFTGRLNQERGMSLWYDMIDWLGGYPFEVARPQEVVDFYKNHGLVLQKLKTCGRRHGCNEFVFRRD